MYPAWNVSHTRQGQPTSPSHRRGPGSRAPGSEDHPLSTRSPPRSGLCPSPDGQLESPWGQSFRGQNWSVQRRQFNPSALRPPLPMCRCEFKATPGTDDSPTSTRCHSLSGARTPLTPKSWSRPAEPGGEEGPGHQAGGVYGRGSRGVLWVPWELWASPGHRTDRLNFSGSERGSFQQLKPLPFSLAGVAKASFGLGGRQGTPSDCSLCHQQCP